MVGQIRVVLDPLLEFREDLGRDEHLEVCLLVNVAVRRTPAVDGMGRLDTIHGWLRVHRDQTTLVELDQVVLDHVGLLRHGGLAPGQVLDLLVQIANEQVSNVADRRRLAPLLAVLLVAAGQANAVGIQLAECRRPRVTPAAVGELIPVLCARHIRLVAVPPKDGPDILAAPPKAQGLLPGEGLLERAVRGRHPLQLLQNHAGRLGEVHGVKVQVADAGSEDLAAHLGD